MANTSNFDSSGLSNGNDMFEVTQTQETQMLKNRTKLFKGLKNVDIQDIENINTYLLGLLTDFNKFGDRLLKDNTKTVRKAQSQVEIVIDNDLGSAFQVGVKNAVEEADEVTEVIPQTTQQADAIRDNTKEASRQSQATAVNTQQTELALLTGAIVGAVFASKQLGQKKTLYEIIDDTTRSSTAKGVTGKVSSNNRRTSLASYNTGVIRENSQKTMLEGGGAVVSDEDDRVFVSEHASASDACRPHQGKYYIDDVYRQGRRGRWNNLPLLSSVIQERGRAGLFHFNCRHTVTKAPSGFDRPQAPNDAKTNKSGSVNSAKSKQTYAIEQEQRKLQRKVRQYKQVEANALTENERIRARQLVKNNQAKLTRLGKVAKRNNIPFYRQSNKENIEFKFEKFKPEF
jgi:hypothetical protein